MQAWLLKPWAKPLVFTLCLLPCAWLFYAAFTDGLGRIRPKPAAQHG